MKGAADDGDDDDDNCSHHDHSWPVHFKADWNRPVTIVALI